MDFEDLENLAAKDSEAMSVLSDIIQRSRAMQGDSTRRGVAAPLDVGSGSIKDQKTDSSPTGITSTAADSDVAAVRSTLSRAQTVATTALRRNRQQQSDVDMLSENSTLEVSPERAGGTAMDRLAQRYEGILASMREAHESQLKLAVSEAERRCRAQAEALHLSAMAEAREKWRVTLEERVADERHAQARETEILIRQQIERERRASSDVSSSDVNRQIADAAAAATASAEVKWQRVLREQKEEEDRRWERILEESIKSAVSGKEEEAAKRLEAAVAHEASRWRAVVAQESAAAQERERKQWEARVPDLIAAAVSASRDGKHHAAMTAEAVAAAAARERSTAHAIFAREKLAWEEKCGEMVASAVLSEAEAWKGRCKAMVDAAVSAKESALHATFEADVRDRVRAAVTDAKAEWDKAHKRAVETAVREAVDNERRSNAAKAADDIAAVKQQMQNRIRKLEHDTEAAVSLSTMENRAAASEAAKRYQLLQSKCDQLEWELQSSKKAVADSAASKRATDMSTMFERQHSEQATRQLVRSCVAELVTLLHARNGSSPPSWSVAASSSGGVSSPLRRSSADDSLLSLLPADSLPSWVHTLLESACREVNLISDDMVRRQVDAARQSLKEQYDARVALLSDEHEHSLASLRLKHESDISRADAEAARVLEDEVQKVMQECMEEATKAKDEALNEWMRKRDSELEDVRRSADRAQEQAVDLALAAAEAEMNHQLSDLSSQLANERATTDDLRQSVKLLISQHDETVRLMTERHQQELEDTKAAHAREVEHAIQTTQADCREEYQRMKEQAFQEWMRDRDREMAQLRAIADSTRQDAVDAAVSAAEHELKQQMSLALAAFQSEKQAALLALDEVWKRRLESASPRYRRRSQSPPHRLSPTFPSSSLHSRPPSPEYIYRTEWTDARRASTGGPPTVSTSVPRLGTTARQSARVLLSGGDRHPSPLLGEYMARPAYPEAAPTPVIQPLHSAPSAQPYVHRMTSPKYSGVLRRVATDKEPHSFRHSVMERLKQQSLTPMTSFRTAATSTDVSTSRAAFVSDRVRRTVSSSSSSSKGDSGSSPTPNDTPWASSSQQPQQQQQQQKSPSPSSFSSSASSVDNSRHVAASLADVRDATLRAAAAFRKAERQSGEVL